jgi:flavin reductase (DIM6/NTAB) family NADH-FMN oxidoreductase RutF
VSSNPTPAGSFLALAKYLACPVVFITAIQDKHRHIMVGTATYASLDPLVLCTNVHIGSATGKAIQATKRLGLSIASHEQLDLVQKLTEAELAREVQMGADKFEYLGIQPLEFKPSGTLYLSDSLASFDCELLNSVDAAGYSTMLCLVKRTASGAGVRPLIRYDRSYGHFTGTVFGADQYPV